MNAAESNEFHMRIDCARAEAQAVAEQLQSTRNDISTTIEAAEKLTVEAYSIKLRREELERDEAALAASEALAVQNKVLAEKRLMEVGGYECVVRVLRKALQKAKLEILDTEDETRALILQELHVRSQIANLTANLTTTQENVARLQQECAIAAAKKRETDEKLHQLSQFLQQALHPKSTSSNIDLRPASPTLP
ncbi:Ribonuclease P protein subunit p25 [Phytophthora boehmeriae]|uniref:Ribonuclease P protein subunit p25 n=1 Tax=Phytophthora boehmeriae TaxID=109152 RepID=A0A8T1X706_9STRA|nr:Ribonuclease P protein subunit p25 [Phytophthora boehmeriae]